MAIGNMKMMKRKVMDTQELIGVTPVMLGRLGIKSRVSSNRKGDHQQNDHRSR
jgi:hypothetical protein